MSDRRDGRAYVCMNGYASSATAGTLRRGDIKLMSRCLNARQGVDGLFDAGFCTYKSKESLLCDVKRHIIYHTGDVVTEQQQSLRLRYEKVYWMLHNLIVESSCLGLTYWALSL